MYGSELRTCGLGAVVALVLGADGGFGWHYLADGVGAVARLQRWVYPPSEAYGPLCRFALLARERVQFPMFPCYPTPTTSPTQPPRAAPRGSHMQHTPAARDR